MLFDNKPFSELVFSIDNSGKLVFTEDGLIFREVEKIVDSGELFSLGIPKDEIICIPVFVCEESKCAGLGLN